MNYIINPSWVYWLNIVDGLKMVFAIAGSLMALTVVGCTVWYICTLVEDADEDHRYNYDKERAVLRPILRRCWIATIILVIGALLIPTKDTLLEMQIAKFATAENAEKAIEAIKSAADYVVESIKSLR